MLGQLISEFEASLLYILLCLAGEWWRMPLIPALGKQREADFSVQGQPGLQREFQDSQGYTEKHCLKKQQQQKIHSWYGLLGF